MTHTPGISVVIPNYNGMTLLPQVLPTVIEAISKLPLDTEILVVDDCSTDDSLAMMATEFPAVRVLRNESNGGFSITANNGIRAAKYDWVLLLNSDVKLEPDYFRPLLPYMFREGVFGVMGRIIGWDDELVQDGAKYPYFHGVKIKTSGNYLFADERQMRKGIFTMYLSGANAFINREIFNQIGGFNELFSPFYVEDFELSLRAWRLGYTCYYSHEAVCRHRTSSTIQGSRRKKQVKKIYNRNKMFLHGIHLDQPQRFLWFLQIIPEALGYFFAFRWTYLQSVSLFLRNYSKVIKSRKAIFKAAGNNRVISLKGVVSLITKPLKDQEIQRF